jgi:hypothetical protein
MYLRSQESDKAAGLTRELGLHSQQGQRGFCSPDWPDRLWGSHGYLSSEWIPEAFSAGVEQSERDADQALAFIVKAKYEQNYVSVHSHVIMALHLINPLKTKRICFI